MFKNNSRSEWIITVKLAHKIKEKSISIGTVPYSFRFAKCLFTEKTPFLRLKSFYVMNNKTYRDSIMSFHVVTINMLILVMSDCVRWEQSKQTCVSWDLFQVRSIQQPVKMNKRWQIHLLAIVPNGFLTNLRKRKETNHAVSPLVTTNRLIGFLGIKKSIVQI